MPIRAFGEMFRKGVTLAMLLASTMKKMVVMTGRKRLPCSLPRISSAMLIRTKSSAYSPTFWTPRGTIFGLRIAMMKNTATSADINRRISIRRSSSKIVPSNSTAGG